MRQLIREINANDIIKMNAFFLSLSDETVAWQNHFGQVNEARWAFHFAVAQSEPSLTQKGFVTFDFDDKKIVAYGWLSFGQKPEQRFTCSLGIVVADAYQGKGIGKQLCEYMISEAKKLGMKKIWLLCYTENARALKLYGRLGFMIEGRFRNQEYSKDDKPRDLYSLALFL